MALMQSQSSMELLNQETMQHHLQTLIEGAHENWTYAILWEPLYDYSGSLILGWSNGYYRGNNNSNGKAKTTTVVVEQELRKKALGKLYSVICGGSDMSNGDEEIVLEDDVPNIEWFFNSSMFYSSIGCVKKCEDATPAFTNCAYDSDKLLGSSNDVDEAAMIQTFSSLFQDQIPEDMKSFMQRVVTEVEIKQVLFSVGRERATRPVASLWNFLSMHGTL
ncbi:transcription factor myc2 [Quercus suber]|uniref:Transcription factor n=1 Tax=Quercus suber TaxID=58331 RepID=A0AAW0LLJ1_QUESU